MSRLILKETFEMSCFVMSFGKGLTNVMFWLSGHLHYFYFVPEVDLSACLLNYQNKTRFAQFSPFFYLQNACDT